MNEADNDNATAYAGVSLFGNHPAGPPPQWHELTAWRSGKLPEERATQILSHVANDPEFFQQWLDLVEAENWAAEEAASTQSDKAVHAAPAKASRSFSADKLRQWLGSLFDQPLPVYGGAFAAVLLAVLIVPMMQQSGNPLQQQLDSSLDLYRSTDAGLPAQPPASRQTRRLSGLFDKLSAPEVEQAHFQRGLRLSAEALGSDLAAPWQTWTTELPGSPLDCENAVEPGDCEGSRDDLTALGQWSLLAYAACEANPQAIADTKVFWQAQLSLYEELSQRPQLAHSQAFGNVLSIQASSQPDSLCERAAALLTLGL